MVYLAADNLGHVLRSELLQLIDFYLKVLLPSRLTSQSHCSFVVCHRSLLGESRLSADFSVQVFYITLAFQTWTHIVAGNRTFVRNGFTFQNFRHHVWIAVQHFCASTSSFWLTVSMIRLSFRFKWRVCFKFRLFIDISLLAVHFVKWFLPYSELM